MHTKLNIIFHSLCSFFKGPWIFTFGNIIFSFCNWLLTFININFRFLNGLLPLVKCSRRILSWTACWSNSTSKELHLGFVARDKWHNVNVTNVNFNEFLTDKSEHYTKQVAVADQRLVCLRRKESRMHAQQLLFFFQTHHHKIDIRSFS